MIIHCVFLSLCLCLSEREIFETSFCSKREKFLQVFITINSKYWLIKFSFFVLRNCTFYTFQMYANQWKVTVFYCSILLTSCIMSLFIVLNHLICSFCCTNVLWWQKRRNSCKDNKLLVKGEKCMLYSSAYFT